MASRRHRLPLAVCLLAGGLTQTGCGSGDPEQVIKDFLTAWDAGDEQRACDLVSKQDEEFLAAIDETCESMLDSSNPPTPEVVDEIKRGKYEVERDRGRVFIRPQSGLSGFELVKEEGEWRVVNPH